MKISNFSRHICFFLIAMILASVTCFLLIMSPNTFARKHQGLFILDWLVIAICILLILITPFLKFHQEDIGLQNYSLKFFHTKWGIFMIFLLISLLASLNLAIHLLFFYQIINNSICLFSSILIIIFSFLIIIFISVVYFMWLKTKLLKFNSSMKIDNLLENKTNKSSS